MGNNVTFIGQDDEGKHQRTAVYCIAGRNIWNSKRLRLVLVKDGPHFANSTHIIGRRIGICEQWFTPVITGTMVPAQPVPDAPGEDYPRSGMAAGESGAKIKTELVQ